MSKKKPPKGAKKVQPAPPADVRQDDAAPLAPSEQNVESDAPAIARRSLEADNDSVGGDVERADE